MKYISAFLVLFFISTSAFSDYVEKPFSIGVGTYRSVIAYDDSFFQDDEFSGLALSFAYAVSNNLAFRANFYSLEHDDLSSFDSSGYDLLAHFGTGFAQQGFKAYIGGGFFKDEWEFGPFDKTFNGLQLNGGIGYNWEAVSLDLVIGIRDSGDYEDFINDTLFTNISAAAISSSLILSARF